MRNYSIIVPVHNEAANVEAFLAAFLERLDQGIRDALLEVLLVENGSTDSTAEACGRLESRFANLVKLIRVPRPSYGEAVKTGMMNSKGAFLSVLECDFLDESFAAESLQLLRAQQADVVIASKRHPKSQDNRPLKRRALTLAFNTLLKMATGYPGTDTHGLKSLRTDVAQKLCRAAKTTDELFQTEIILIAWKMGHSVREIPISIRERRATPVSIRRRLPKVLDMICQLRRSLKRFN